MYPQQTQLYTNMLCPLTLLRLWVIGFLPSIALKRGRITKFLLHIRGLTERNGTWQSLQ